MIDWTHKLISKVFTGLESLSSSDKPAYINVLADIDKG